jgi:hypothetical protein
MRLFEVGEVSCGVSLIPPARSKEVMWGVGVASPGTRLRPHDEIILLRLLRAASDHGTSPSTNPRHCSLPGQSFFIVSVRLSVMTTPFLPKPKSECVASPAFSSE